jgi:K+-sensing histidine kinase KdpD
MMSTEHPKPEPPSYEELLRQNQALRQDLEEFRNQESFIWNLFTETSRKFQVYSASIKAAVSSLLDHDIFWDSANQHEFLESIDNSVNQVSEINALLTLAFRAQANNLVLSTDFHLLQEILSASQVSALKKMPELKLAISFPQEGKPVLVDYEYLNKALVLLYEVLHSQTSSTLIRIVATETDGSWYLDFSGIPSSLVRIIERMHRYKTQPKSNEILSAENILRLHVMCEILHLQQISVETTGDPELSPMLRLCVPDITNL